MMERIECLLPKLDSGLICNRIKSKTIKLVFKALLLDIKTKSVKHSLRVVHRWGGSLTKKNCDLLLFPGPENLMNISTKRFNFYKTNVPN